MTNPFKINPHFKTEIESQLEWTLPTADANTVNTSLTAWNSFKNIFQEAVGGGNFLSKPIITTYSLVSTGSNFYVGGVLAADGSIHYGPFGGSAGQKIAANGTVSTYSLVATRTAGQGSYYGGVLAPDGSIHFCPFGGTVGQKVAANGTVYTYTLVVAGGAQGGVLGPDGSIHFVPNGGASVGQKVAANGTVSTYSLVYTTVGMYSSGVLAPDGSIHYVPYAATVGQKVAANGTVSTYSLVYTSTLAYEGGVLAPDGSIHFVPYYARVGQKVAANWHRMACICVRERRGRCRQGRKRGSEHQLHPLEPEKLAWLDLHTSRANRRLLQTFHS